MAEEEDSLLGHGVVVVVVCSMKRPASRRMRESVVLGVTEEDAKSPGTR